MNSAKQKQKRNVGPKATVDFPFQLTQNQFEVIQELAEIAGEPLSEWIRWTVIKTAEMDIEDGRGTVGTAVCKRLGDKWGPMSPYWPEAEEEGEEGPQPIGDIQSNT